MGPELGGSEQGNGARDLGVLGACRSPLVLTAVDPRYALAMMWL